MGKEGMEIKKVLVLGATGMLGHTLFYHLSKCGDFDVYATARSLSGLSKWFSPELLEKVWGNVEAGNFESIIRAVAEIKPDVVINCIGIIKQLPAANDHLTAININALLPHRLALICRAAGARLIHVSTDCVFDGAKGRYTEKDISNAGDLYGRTKFLGEVSCPPCVTLRTSIIGHELKGKHGLIEWFMAQRGKVRGFTSAVYSGFPTIELARIFSTYVIPNVELNGLYHVSADPVSKYDLLKLVADRYNKQIEIEPDGDFHSNRALDSDLFRRVTDYTPPAWPELIDTMYRDYASAPYYKGVR